MPEQQNLTVHVCLLSDDETWEGCCSGLHPAFQEPKNPAVFMTSFACMRACKHTHTVILIAVSLLQGEKIGYLKASLTHLLPPTCSAAVFPPSSLSLLLDFLHVIACVFYFAFFVFYGLFSYPLLCWVCLVFLLFFPLPQCQLCSTRRCVENNGRKWRENCGSEDK